jgi:Zn-dependent protease with chaperone function
MSMMSANYFDGRSARLHPVQLQVDAGTLLVSAPDAERSYPLGAVALAEPFAAAPAVLRFDDGASCEVAGDGRQQLLDALGYRKSAVARWQARWPAVLLALVMLVLLLALLYFRGLPAAAERIAAELPPSVDIQVGKAALASMEKQGLLGPSRLSDERIAEVEALLPRVLPPHPRLPIRLLVRNSTRLGANALALPDGTIVVTDWMVRLVQARNNQLDDAGKEQLAAVLAHEVGHIEHRHAVRAMAGSSLVAALSATLFGDFSAVAAGLPAVLSQMQYSRAMELDADDYAVAALRRQGASPAAFIRALQALDRQQPDASSTPRWMKDTMSYMSTHPDTAERIRRMRLLVDEHEEEDEDDGH